MPVRLKPVSLGYVSAIRVSYFLGRSRRAEGSEILIIKYDGVCRDGDDGETDGRFMLAMAKAGLTAWEPDGLIVDLSGLECRQLVGGLTLLLDLGEGEYGSENLPQAVVVGSGSEPAIRPFFARGIIGVRPEAVQEYYHDVENAMNLVEREAAVLDVKFSTPRKDARE